MKKALVRIRQAGGGPWLRHFRHSLMDMRNHGFLHGIAWVTIVLTVVMAGAFLLFAGNASKVISSWEAGVKIMAYLEDGLSEKKIAEIRAALEQEPDLVSAKFISREEAMEILRSRMGRHTAIFEGLPENPLPDAFEIYVKSGGKGWQLVDAAAKKIEQVDGVAEVESGGQWIDRLLRVVNLFRFFAIGTGALFFLVSVFIVSNTIRLAFYSRKEEIEIMRLVGATESFIKTPFYIQSVLLGLSGGLFGILILYLLFWSVTLRMGSSFSALAFGFHFLSLSSILVILGLCILVGLMGAYLSFRQEIGE